MAERDRRFADDLEPLKRDLLAVVDLVAELVEDPGLWRHHAPGEGSWPWRLWIDPGSARVVHPAERSDRRSGATGQSSAKWAAPA
jgi:hypothetical protein